MILYQDNTVKCHENSCTKQIILTCFMMLVVNQAAANRVRLARQQRARQSRAGEVRKGTRERGEDPALDIYCFLNNGTHRQ